MRRVALVLLLALTAACGSTVQQVGQTSVAGGGLEGVEDAAEDTTAGELGETALETTDATTGPAARRPAGAGTVPGAAQAAAVQAAGTRGGAVKIGIRYPNNSGGLLTTFGFSSVDPGDSKAMAETVVADINSRGGIAGRRIEPVYFPFDVTASIAPGGGESENQKACSAFTEDNKVFAVVSPILSGEILETCLAKRGVVFVDENWNYYDPGASGPGYWTPAYPDPVRSVHALVDRLWATGFLAPGSKVGAVYQDLPNRKRVLEAGLRAGLARHGLKIDDSVGWSGRDSSQLAAGVLKFRSTSITHVFVLDPGGLETFAWMTEAEGQAFRPKYAIDTRNYPFLQQGQSPPAQLANARGIGWVPAADVGVQPAEELNAAERRCLGVVAKAGQNMNDATNVRVALAYCETLEFLKTAAGDASTELTLATVQRGGEALGDRFGPIGTFRIRFGPGRHDGAAGARDLAYDVGCSCFRYSGPVFAIG